MYKAVFRSRIHRIQKFFGLPGPPGSGSGSVIISTDPDPSITKQKFLLKTFIPTLLELFHDVLSLKTDGNVPTVNKKLKNFEKTFFVGFLKATDE